MRRRSVGLWLILAGLVLVSLAVFVLLAVETTVFGPGVFLGCGTAMIPVPGRDAACGPALLELRLVGGGLGLAGIATLTSGTLLRALTPRPLAF